jgi:hypothetical protein
MSGVGSSSSSSSSSSNNNNNNNITSITDSNSNSNSNNDSKSCSSKGTSNGNSMSSTSKSSFILSQDHVKNKSRVDLVASSQDNSQSSFFQKYLNSNKSTLDAEIEEPISRILDVTPSHSKFNNFISGDVTDEEIKKIYENYYHTSPASSQVYKDQLFVIYYNDFVKRFYPSVSPFPLQATIVSSFIRSQALAKYSIESIEFHHIPALKRHSATLKFLVGEDIDEAIKAAHHLNRKDPDSIKRGNGQHALSEADFCYCFSNVPSGYFDKWRTLSACSYGIAAGPRCMTINHTSLSDILDVVLVDSTEGLYKIVLLQRFKKGERGVSDTRITLFGSLDKSFDPINVVSNLQKHLLENFSLDLKR